MSGGIILSYIHNPNKEFFEKGSFERFSKGVGSHVPGGTLLIRDLLGCDSVGNKKVWDVNVLGAFAA
jgi:hypothetical protein